jgi:hypothetical protein
MANDFGFIEEAPQKTNDFGFIAEDVPTTKQPKRQASPVDAILPTPKPWVTNLDNTLTNFGLGFTNSLNNLGQSVYEQGIDKPIDYLFGTKLTANDKALDAADQQKFQQQMQGSTAAKVGGIAGDVAPFMLGGEAFELANAPEVLGSKLLGQIKSNAIYGAGANAITGNDPLQGADVGIAGIPVGKAINSTINAFRPSTWASKFSKGTTPEELAQNLAVTQGTNTPLGDVINSPTLKRLNDNILTKIPFSGAVAKQQKTVQQINERGNGLMNELLGNTVPGDVGATLQQSLKDQYKTLQAIKRENFAKPNDIADSIGMQVGRQNFSQAAQQELENISQSPELARELDPALVKDLRAYADPEASNTLKLSNIFKSKIGEKASEHFVNGKNYEYGIYKNLRDALDKDIEGAIAGSGSDELKGAHSSAMEFYKENIAPFEDPNIVKFTKEGGDADTLLSTFIKPSSINDRGNLINTLVSKLPDSQQHLPAYGYFSKALKEDGTLDPLSFAKKYNVLGNKQRQALIPDAQLRQKVDSYAKLVSKNKAALTSMDNNPTGQKIMDLLPGALGLAGYSAGGLSGGLAGLGATAAVSRPITWALTSPSVREKLLQKMIQGGNQTPTVGNKLLGGISGIPNTLK